MVDMGENSVGYDFYAQQAITLSGGWSDKFFDSYRGERFALRHEDVAVLAASRLQWLLESGRRSLSGRFTRGEINQLLNCFHAEVFAPDMFNSIAASVVEDSGADELIAAGGAAPAIVEKLKRLSPLERVTLADALEQSWYRAQGELTHFDVFEQLGIAFE